jgi:hypothetical protein
MTTEQAKELLQKQEEKRKQLLAVLQNRDGRAVDIKNTDGLEITIGVNIRIDPSLTLWGTVKLHRTELKDTTETHLIETVHTLLDEQLMLQLLTGIWSEVKS